MLQQRWRNRDVRSLEDQATEFRSTHQISLDAVNPETKLDQTTSEKPEYRSWGRRQDIQSGHRQHELARWMADDFADGICVFRLGTFSDPQFVVHYCGLILEYNGDVTRRVGICIWPSLDNAEACSGMMGDIWKKKDVYFE